jgi:hypothetical protein
MYTAIQPFSTSTPKDAADGVLKGVSNVLKGGLGAVAMILVAPVKGAMDGHSSGGALGAVKGFGMGLGAGVLGGTAVAFICIFCSIYVAIFN